MKTISIVLASAGDPDEARASIAHVRRQAALLPWQAGLLVTGMPSDTAPFEDGPVAVRMVDAPAGASATRAAVMLSEGDYVLPMRLGTPVPVGQVQRLVPHLDRGAQVVIGSSCLGRRTSGRGPSRALLNFIVGRLLLPGFRDALGAFTCYPGPVARQVFSLARCSDRTVGVEAIAIARALGYTVAEAPVETGGPAGPAPSLREVLGVRWRLNHSLGRPVRHAT